MHLARFDRIGCFTGQFVPRRDFLDTEIGDHIDDAFAPTLATRSPKLEIVGITMVRVDTALRAAGAETLERKRTGCSDCRGRSD